jgi:hypothetical protein
MCGFLWTALLKVACWLACSKLQSTQNKTPQGSRFAGFCFNTQAPKCWVKTGPAYAVTPLAVSTYSSIWLKFKYL